MNKTSPIYLVTAAFFLAYSSLAIADEKYPFLDTLDTVKTFKEGKRTIYIVGETHEDTISDENSKKKYEPYAKVFGQVRSLISERQAVFLDEATIRGEDDEILYLKLNGLDPDRVGNYFYGLEDGYVKGVALLGIGYFAADQLYLLMTSGRISEQELERGITNFMHVMSLNFSALSRSPLFEYWKKLAENPKIAENAQYKAIDKFNDTNHENNNNAIEMEAGAHGKFLSTFLRGEDVAETVGYTRALLKEMARLMVTDTDVALTKRQSYNIEIFNEETTDQTFLKHMERSSKTRERAMLQNIHEAMNAHPEKDIFIKVGASHCSPLLEGLQAAK